MTGDERLAKVASAIHHAAERCVHPEYADAPCERWADALEPLLDEFRAEDEARALREAADAGASSTATDQLWRMWLRDRAALAAAEPADWASAVNAASLRAVKTLHASAVLTEHWSCDGQTEGATVRWSCGIETPSGPSPRQAHLAYALAAAEPDAGER